MDAWYAAVPRRFPKAGELDAIDDRLSVFDTRYKQLWDLSAPKSTSSGV